jgi:hypothetical protein
MTDQITIEKDDLVGQQQFLDEHTAKEPKTIRNRTKGLVDAVKNAINGKNKKKTK